MDREPLKMLIWNRSGPKNHLIDLRRPNGLHRESTPTSRVFLTRFGGLTFEEAKRRAYGKSREETKT